VKVLCAWRLKEGKLALLGEKEPLGDPTGTYGACDYHRLQVKAQMPSVLSRLRDEAATAGAGALRPRDAAAVQRLFQALVRALARN